MRFGVPGAGQHPGAAGRPGPFDVVTVFDDSRLESPDLIDDEGLRNLATSGARIRRAAHPEALPHLSRADRPRGVLAIGPEARLVRAVLEPVCPVPFMAWPGPGLPAWVGPLDLVVIIGDGAPYSWLVDAGSAAARRGARILVAAPERSELARVTQSSGTTLLLSDGVDATSSAVAVIDLLGQLGIGPAVNLEQVAEAADLVAEECSPVRDLSNNPGKELALQLADHIPLIWGGTVLAGRASRRISEAIRRVSGLPTLAADASEVLAVLRGVERRDPFADPEDGVGNDPVLVLLDADKAGRHEGPMAEELERVADAVGVRVARITSGDAALTSSDVERYVRLLAYGLYGAEYLRIGLGK
ncbi:MAG: hypothetical protein GX596_02515 [Propionibacterium sp.]|nr:hypothetical protein [Propionibacterium sp.]